MSTLFAKLWKNHPIDTDPYPCDEALFTNQCAIRLGVSLEKSGIDTGKFDVMFPKRRCSSAYPALKDHRPGHILSAQELANWLYKSGPFGKPKIYKSASTGTFGRNKGIIFIMNGWGNTDHIDLWDGTKSDMRGGDARYLARGQQVWFWKID